MQVRIYRPAKSAMQSGRANSKRWVLEFEPQEAKEIDPLMGWIGSGDTSNQLRLRFDSKEEAIAYAERQGLSYRVFADRPRRDIRPKSYADNFRFDRVV